MEQNPQIPEEPAPVMKRFSSLPERTRPEDYIQEVDVDQVNYVEPAIDDWLKNSAG